MTELRKTYFELEVAKGNISGHSAVNKFGRAPSGGQVTPTDVWDRADNTPTQQIWTAPTTARTHDVVSNDANDDGAPVGTGARTIKVSGLTGWGTNEVSENIIMNGTTNVPTGNAYVIIHRLEVLTKGASGPNVGVITATAQTDATVTAQINAGEGQTQMAIYGVPSTQVAYMMDYYLSISDASAVGSGEGIMSNLLVNPEPDSELTAFLTKHSQGVAMPGTTLFRYEFEPPYKIPGPAIIKMQVTTETADVDTYAGFDLILVDN